MFAKPWETQDDAAVQAAKDDAAHKPWDPKGKPPPPQIVEQARQNAQVGGRNYAIDKIKAQAFAKAYLVDFDAMRALVRIGEADENTESQYHMRRANAYLRNPVVLQSLQAFISRVESDKIVSRERILFGLLEEATYHGLGASASARVAAWSKLAKLMGMELPPEDPTKNVRGGVMLVPMAGGIEEWEAAARGQQAKLKADVRT